jgi:hypothetical protein
MSRDTEGLNQATDNQPKTQTQTTEIDLNKIKADRIKNGFFLTLITSLGLLSGFGLTLTTTKKKETQDLTKPLPNNIHELRYSGTLLARRALLIATCYSVGGFSLFCFTVWKLSGAKTFEEFRFKVGSFLPKLKKGTEGRTEFDNLTDLFQYVIDEDKKKRLSQQQQQQQQNKEK